LFEATCFFVLLAAGYLAFVAGRRVRRGGQRPAMMLAAAATALLATWLWLFHHPAIALKLMSSSVLACLEGTAALPPVMLLLGIAWADAQRQYQRVMTVAAALLCAGYFLFGGIWMIQPTTAESLNGSENVSLVPQTADYSCVPAACATALNQLGIHTSEAQMALLTRTHPFTGATLIRAVDGLNRRLVNSPFRAEMIDLADAPLTPANVPALAALRFERSQSHLIAVLNVHRFGVDIFDPVGGKMFMPTQAFERYALKSVIVFREAEAPNHPPQIAMAGPNGIAR